MAGRLGQSEFGQALSLFEPVLPAEVARLIASPSARDGAMSEQPHRPPRVLLVDDCPVQLLLGCVLLARWQIVPELANDGLEAVLLAREQEFDLLLMDVEMPVLDGLTATRRIRQHEEHRKAERRVPVVAYTANETTLNERTWRESGMNAVLGKPSEEKIIGECLRRWCPDKFKPSRSSP